MQTFARKLAKTRTKRETLRHLDAEILHLVEMMPDRRLVACRHPRDDDVRDGRLDVTRTQAEHIQVLGTDSSGEVERVIVALDDGLWLTVGSDHTDRIEADVPALDRPTSLTGRRSLRALGSADCPVVDDARGKRVLYQEGPLALMLHPADLIQRTILICATIGAKRPLAHADLFEMELEDPVLGRRIRHHYKVEALRLLA